MNLDSQPEDRLLWSLVVSQQILLYRLPDSSRENRLLLGWVLSFSILRTPHRHLTSPHIISLMLGRWEPMMFWAVLPAAAPS